MPLVLIWLVMTQPTFATSPLSNKHVAAAKLRDHVHVLAEKYAPRDYTHIDNLNRCADYIRMHFKQAGATSTTFQTFSKFGQEYKNVVALFGDPEQERLIIGAHYDAVTSTPGADDNASGVAGLIELARPIAKLKPAQKIMLVAFSLEEPPFFDTAWMGSAVFAKSLLDARKGVRIMIALEMIGYFSDEPGSQAYPISLLKLFYPDKGNFIAVVDQLFSNKARKMKVIMRNNTEIPVRSINAPSVIPGVDFSDHKSFWQLGFPAVMITDTAFFRNKAYHTRHDTADRLDYERMAQVVYGIFAYVRAISRRR